MSEKDVLKSIIRKFSDVAFLHEPIGDGRGRVEVLLEGGRVELDANEFAAYELAKLPTQRQATIYEEAMRRAH